MEMGGEAADRFVFQRTKCQNQQFAAVVSGINTGIPE